MSAQVKNLLAALPGTLPELVERTGYPIRHVLGFIALARIEGNKIDCVRGAGGITTFILDNPSPVNHNEVTNGSPS